MLKQDLAARIAHVEAETAVGLILDLVGIGVGEGLEDPIEFAGEVRARVSIQVHGSRRGVDLQLDDEPPMVIGLQPGTATVALIADHQRALP